MNTTRTVEVRDSNGQLVGAATVPPSQVRRLWKQSAQITWACDVSGCAHGGTGATEEDALASIRSHVTSVHAVEL